MRAPAQALGPRGRPVAARVLVVAASVVLALALVAGYARAAIVDSDQFANRAAAAPRDDSVRRLAAERIADQVVAEQPDVLAARPIIARSPARSSAAGRSARCSRRRCAMCTAPCSAAIRRR